MISLITDFLLIMAVNSTSDSVSTGLILLIAITAFILSTVIFGICSYKIKLKKLREKNSENDVNNSNKQGG